MRKRLWLKRSGLMLSALASMAAPAKAELSKVKNGKKTVKPSAHHAAKDEAADNRPPSAPASPAKPGVPTSQTGPVKLSEIKQSGYQVATNKGQHAIYPWKTNIATTVFWIGEESVKGNPTPNDKSSWDTAWASNYGGFDNPSPKARKGFLPANFTPKQNPFYVALPYNDISLHGHKAEAREVIPWFKKDYTGRYKSVCKGRWIAIRKGNRVCYAQWEDAGPFRTDDAAYVFGDARPKPNRNHNAGLDVSPAVRDFLGISGMDVTDWRFVDFDEVPYGPWAELGENNHFVMARKKAGEQQAVAARSTPTSPAPASSGSSAATAMASTTPGARKS